MGRGFAQYNPTIHPNTSGTCKLQKLPDFCWYFPRKRKTVCTILGRDKREIKLNRWTYGGRKAQKMFTNQKSMVIVRPNIIVPHAIILIPG